MTNLDDDVEVLAATIWGEARGEPLAGQKAVACVVMNRVASARAKPRKQFGDGSVRSACLAPWQFSSWNANDPNRAKLLALDFSAPDAVLEQCTAVAIEAIAGGLVDETHGAPFYKVTSLPWPKDWGPIVAPLAVIGHHSFYNLDATA